MKVSSSDNSCTERQHNSAKYGKGIGRVVVNLETAMVFYELNKHFLSFRGTDRQIFLLLDRTGLAISSFFQSLW